MHSKVTATWSLGDEANDPIWIFLPSLQNKEVLQFNYCTMSQIIFIVFVFVLCTGILDIAKRAKGLASVYAGC